MILLLDCIADRLGNGKCDDLMAEMNTAGCGYDGGDCCVQTCRDATFSCGSGGYVFPMILGS